MHKAMRIAVITLLAVTAGMTAYADFGFGNREEPALRPYKGLWRGVKALTYNIVDSLNTGNRKFPGLGMVELGRGTRYGAIELGYSTYMGMAGSRPAPVKSRSWPNDYLDSDWLLRNSADLVGGAVFWGGAGSFRSKAEAAGDVFIAQKVVDHSPVLSPREKRLYLPESSRYAAQREYLGKRDVKPRKDGDIDFVARARRQGVPKGPILPPDIGRAPASAIPGEGAAPSSSLPPSNHLVTPVPSGGEVISIPPRDITPMPPAPLEVR